VNHARQQADDQRTGREWAAQAARASIPPGPSPATVYPSLTAELVRLRASLATDGRTDRPLTELRRGHDDLNRALAKAMAFAFAADARGAATPEGITSWMAEGLARSLERELAMLAAMDVCGLPQPMLSPNRYWADPPTRP
jgi:hypothetical protein